jgi:hypothetical protein
VWAGEEPGRSIEAWATLRLGTPVRGENENGSVEAIEIAPALGLRRLAGGPRLSAGGAVELAARLLRARTSAIVGEDTTAWYIVPVALAAATARARLGEQVELAVLAGAEVALVRQRFTLQGTEVVDLGVVRPIAQVSVLIPIR